MSDDVCPGDDVGRRIRNAHTDKLHACHHVGAFVDAGETLCIKKKHLRRRVRQAIGHLFGGPPRVHADNGDANRHACPIDQHPFRIIAHGDRNAVTGLYALGHQPGCNGIRPGVGLRIGQALVFINEVVPFGELQGGQPDFAHTWRRVLVGQYILTQHLGPDDFERAAGPGQFFARFLELSVMHVSPRSCCLVLADHAQNRSQRNMDAGATGMP